ncbi:MAG: hypothetical protein ACRC4T_08505 [Cetobacterium sp.]
MKYEELKRTKFFENFEKAFKGELILESQPTKEKNRIYTCVACGRIILEYREGKYIIDESIGAILQKEKRVKCICGKVNIFLK